MSKIAFENVEIRKIFRNFQNFDNCYYDFSLTTCNLYTFNIYCSVCKYHIQFVITLRAIIYKFREKSDNLITVIFNWIDIFKYKKLKKYI